MNAGDGDDEKKAETTGNGTAAAAAAAAAAGLESEESGAFVDAPSAAESNGNGCGNEYVSSTDVTGFDTDGDALHLRYSSILRGTLSPSPSKEMEEEEVRGAE